MKLYKLNDVVLRIKGHSAKFLNGLTTNTLEAPRSAFVNLHGRIIATFYQQALSGEEALIAVVPSTVEPLLTHLKMYAKISGTVIETTALKVYVNLDTKEYVFKEEEILSHVTEEEFTNFRLEMNLPLQDMDYKADEFILNVDQGQFVSFTKGCFLGQEPVAKVHNRSKPTKKLVVKFEDEVIEEKASMTSKVKDSETGRVRGFVFVKNI